MASIPPSPLSPVSNPTCPTRSDRGQQRVGDCYHTFPVSSLPSRSSSHLLNPSPLSPSLQLGASLHSDSGTRRRETEPLSCHVVSLVPSSADLPSLSRPYLSPFGLITSAYHRATPLPATPRRSRLHSCSHARNRLRLVSLQLGGGGFCFQG